MTGKKMKLFLQHHIYTTYLSYIYSHNLCVISFVPLKALFLENQPSYHSCTVRKSESQVREKKEASNKLSADRLQPLGDKRQEHYWRKEG